MEKVTSFTINHLKLKPGIYVSRIDHVNGNPLTTFDLRMTTPNKEPVMNTAEVHTIEHLGATFPSQSSNLQRSDYLFRTNGMPYRILFDPCRRVMTSKEIVPLIYRNVYRFIRRF